MPKNKDEVPQALLDSHLKNAKEAMGGGEGQSGVRRFDKIRHRRH